MTKTRETSIKSYTTYLQQNKIPPEYIECAIELTKAFFNNTTPSIRHTSATTSTIIQAQTKIGIELFTRGFLSTQWLQTMIQNKHRHPKTKIKLIIQGLWHHIMEPIWEQRNNILHKSDNIVTQTAHMQADSELQDWKTLASERLHSSQQHLTSYCKADFKYWTLQHKHNTLHILQTAHRNYKQFLKSNIAAGFQTTMTQFINTA